ncbi:MAG: hypothetical protein KF912_13655 [Phycisphaeraceae bacterium]|nr:hypothetical protein [Phycisphaeraceae bacterium]MBX3368352.1 hypothetical protein [Phycisphaeraceae bacterium]QYK48863.1 MAG: hypothetical protein KF838_03200 [Phycisphaeraceae bacterium]
MRRLDVAIKRPVSKDHGSNRRLANTAAANIPPPSVELLNGAVRAA